MSQRPKDGDTGVNTFMLIFIFVFFGGIALYTIFGLQAPRRLSPNTKDKSVAENLRQLAIAADQYFVEHPGVSSVAYATLIGTSSKQYLMPFAIVANETYQPVIVKGQPVTASGVAGTRTVTYAP